MTLRLSFIYLLCMFIAALGIVAPQHLERAWFSDTSVNFSGPVVEEFAGALWDFSENDACWNEFGINELRQSSWWFCFVTDTGKETVALLGNSHANSLVPGFIDAGYDVISIGACDLTQLIILQGVKNPCSEENLKYNATAVSNAMKTIKPSIIVVAGLLTDQNQAYYTKLDEVLKELSEESGKVIVVSPHPELTFHPRNCYERPFIEKKVDCFNLQLEIDLIGQIQSFLKRQSANEKVSFVDISDLFCTRGSCEIIQNGLPIYRDEVHISKSFSSTVVKRILQDISGN